jgi:hypothetical protein
MKSPLRIVSYARDPSMRKDKFAEFDRMIRDSAGTIDAVTILAPRILSDTFQELVSNPDKLANAELMLLVVPSSQRQSGYKLN